MDRKLDYIDNLEISSNLDEDNIFDAQMTLARLSQGLFWLHNEVKKAEIAVLNEAIKGDVFIGVVGGVMGNIPTDWLSCAFQWYAVSAYNYVRLTGWLATSDETFAKEYVRKVIPRVTEYRHKVAAHFAITYPKNDNEADKVSSLITNIIFAKGRLRGGAVSETITKDGKEIKSKNRTSWSMTNVHNKLIPRYWTSGPLDVHKSLSIGSKKTRKFTFDYSDS